MLNSCDLLYHLAPVVFWLSASPKVVALITEDIVDEKIGQSFTAWIDRRFRGSILAYLFRCKRCLSHWVAASLWVAYVPMWELLPFGFYGNCIISLMSLGASIRTTRKYFTEND